MSWDCCSRGSRFMSKNDLRISHFYHTASAGMTSTSLAKRLHHVGDHHRVQRET